MTHCYGGYGPTSTSANQSTTALERCKPVDMNGLLVNTLSFLCTAALQGVGPVSGMSVLCNVRGSKEQVFRALKLLTSQNQNMLMPYDAPIAKFACPATVNSPTAADELYDVTDLLWAMDRLHMLYRLAQASA
jgi:hypothetical protein